MNNLTQRIRDTENHLKFQDARIKEIQKELQAEMDKRDAIQMDLLKLKGKQESAFEMAAEVTRT